MAKVKHEQVSYSDSIINANLVVQIFYGLDSYYPSFDEVFADEEYTEAIVDAITKPSKITLLHLYISWIESNKESLNDVFNNIDIDSYSVVIHFELNSLQAYGIEIDAAKVPDFNIIKKCSQCEECKECKKLSQCKKWILEKKNEIRVSSIHTTFQILILNKNFLRDFHEEFAEYFSRNLDRFQKIHPNFFKKDGKVKRCGWPSWLERGIFFRDRGVCVICRNDLSGQLALGIELQMDHIVPLANFGTNDSSNLQLLCDSCNNKKKHFSSETSSYDNPIWNLTKKDKWSNLL